MRRISLFSSLMLVAGSVPAIASAQQDPLEENKDAKVLELPSMDVSASRAPLAETEGTGSYTTGQTSAATRLPLSIKETPQSVSVVTRQRMDDQQLRSVQDVLENTTGLSASTYDYRSTYYARGFSINSFQFDGIPTTFVEGANYLDTAFYDRVEVVRGSTGLLTGAGNPSASINMVRKRPTRDFQGEISASAGSWDNYRGTADLSTPLSESGRVRGRLVGVYEDADSFVDQAHSRKNAFYGVVDTDITPDTTLSLGYEYQEPTQHGMQWGGMPMFYSDGGRTDWSRSKSLAADWSRWSNRITTAFTNIEHRFDNGWTLRGAFNQARTDEEGRLFSPDGYVDRATNTIAANALAYHTKIKQDSYDLMASGPFSFLGREHELVVGGMQSKRDLDSASTGHLFRKISMDPISISGYNGNYPEPDFNAAGYDSLTDSTIRQKGIYTVGRFSLSDPLKLIVGGRLSTYSYDSDSANSNFSKRKFVPYAGLVYDLDETYSVYASHTAIFNPQTNMDTSGNVLAPTEGKTNEVGIKAGYFDGLLNASFAVFETKQDNVAQQDPSGKTPSGGTAYYAASGTKSKGFDIDLQGQLTPDWNLSAGVSHFTASTGDGYRLSTTVPRTTAKLFSTYRLPGELNQFTVGAGLNWQSRFYQATSTPNGTQKLGQESFALASLMARYDITDSTNLTLNVNNLFDKEYYRMVGFYSQEVYGAPRNAMLTLNHKL
ncbi:TonB-dependent siderophore receptor [Pseudomonas aeruginosa]|uniref:TonB-dependent siderophore receptor n=1 Tax=Pseudomonas aeruginosa TaxID=287 RepID=UPI000B9C7F8E|nr:TonB-dependent siderophore receptor [Pseudomonas aeruginosa]ELP1307739.1 TonB-dependent siderophore receptor [Pseudomonas aeruginosa]MBH4114822.1 TonB-dependent siderophore receptor [Pseudomonas aeruginosa]OXR76801.1 hypothetical protein IPC1580_28205 [Pseudomonas aeruginosa]